MPIDISFPIPFHSYPLLIKKEENRERERGKYKIEHKTDLHPDDALHLLLCSSAFFLLEKKKGRRGKH